MNTTMTPKATVSKVHFAGGRGIGTKVTLPDGWSTTFIGPMPKGEAVRQALEVRAKDAVR